MNTLERCASRTITSLSLIGACLSIVSLAHATPTVSRLTPPSALFSFNDPGKPYIARFLPGQRFDLQATVQPDASKTITSAQYSVDGVLIDGDVAMTSATVP